MSWKRRQASSGSVPEMADELERRQELYGFSYIVVPEAAMETFAPLVELLRGR